MIEIRECSKAFGALQAVNNVSMDIGEREVFGLVGSNGAGKSTLLRMVVGILKPDKGSITVDDMEVYDNETAKELFFYISDDCYFPTNFTPADMAAFYRLHYPKFEIQRFSKLMRQFRLDEKQRISSFSKGMKKLLMVLLGISAGTKYLLCDETFDGLDPVVRQAVKSIFASEIMKRDFTPIIASHNLRELEDICDHVGLLYKGGILLSKELEEMKYHIYKVQCVFQNAGDEEEILAKLEVLQHEKRGSVMSIVARGTKQEILMTIQEKNPLLAEILPLTLEEIFISETEVAGYEVKNIFW